MNESRHTHGHICPFHPGIKWFYKRRFGDLLNESRHTHGRIGLFHPGISSGIIKEDLLF